MRKCEPAGVTSATNPNRSIAKAIIEGDMDSAVLQLRSLASTHNLSRNNLAGRLNKPIGKIVRTEAEKLRCQPGKTEAADAMLERLNSLGGRYRSKRRW
jgi:hypothetical protein